MYSFRYKGTKSFEYGTVTLRIPVGEKDEFIDAPVHKDFLNPVSGLMRQIQEDASNPDEMKIIQMPSNATPEAIDEFLCKVYGVSLSESSDGDDITSTPFNVFIFIDNILEYIAVLDFFQANMSFYSEKDDKISARLERAHPSIMNLTQLLELLAKLEKFPLLENSFTAAKKAVVRANVDSIFDGKIFANYDILVKLRSETIVDIWKACDFYQKMIWASEYETGDRLFRKRKLDSDDMKDRLKSMSSYFTYTPWTPSFWASNRDDVRITLISNQPPLWPVELAEFTRESKGRTTRACVHMHKYENSFGVKADISHTNAFVRGLVKVWDDSNEENEAVHCPLDSWVDKFTVVLPENWTRFEFQGSVRLVKH